jgi:Mn-dependent DtxR family transcriptional regulator
LQLDLIIEEYVERVTESQKQHELPSPKTTMMKMTEKEQELLKMIQRRDTDVVSAVTLLHISRQKFDTMIQKLLQLEMLQYLSDNEVKLTEKGLQYLSDQNKK